MYQRMTKLKQIIVGWVNYFGIADMGRLAKTLDMWLRRRIRMCFWKQWKKIKTKHDNLVALGVPSHKAWEHANTRKSYWRTAGSPILSKTLTNEHLRRIYNKNPENNRIIDILGFACNLCGDFFTEFLEQNGQNNDADVLSIYELNQFGLKIRERMFNMFPDDVWAIRGYAWSLHCKGKLELNNNEDEAKKWFSKAEAVRLKGEYKYPEDLGIKEDLVDNYTDFIKHFGLKDEVKPNYRINFIREREGNSPRVIRLEKKLKEALSNNFE